MTNTITPVSHEIDGKVECTYCMSPDAIKDKNGHNYHCPHYNNDKDKML